MAAHRMTADEVRAFLSEEPPHTGVLATSRADGRPHAAPVWYAMDDDGSLLMTTSRDTLKGRHLAARPWAALCVEDERSPFAFATLSGPVTLSEELAEVRRWAGLIGGRYMGAERAEEFGERNGVPGELLVRLVPDHVVGMRDLAD